MTNRVQPAHRLRRTLGLLTLLGGMAPALPAWGAQISVPAGASVDFGSGRAAFHCADLAIAGLVQGGSAALASLRDVTIQSGGTLSGDSAYLYVSGNWDNQGSFVAGTSTVQFEDGCRTTTILSGDSDFYNLVFTSSSGKTFQLASGSTQSVSNSLVIAGTPTNPLTLDNTDGSGPAYLDVAESATTDIQDANIIPGHIVFTGQVIPTLSWLAVMLLSLLTLGAARRRLGA